MVVVWDIESKSQFDEWSAQMTSSIFREKEAAILKEHDGLDAFSLSGYCRVCEQEADFVMDRQCGAVDDNGLWIPNWRERLVCPHCGLNNRQRMAVFDLRGAVRSFRDRRPEVYLMEQITNVYKSMPMTVPYAIYTGSEYLCSEIRPGKVINGIRHEDVQNLSFTDNRFDIVLSNDVLEHVADPLRSLEEVYRVLRPRGELFLTVPFHLNKEKTERRAQVINGKLEDILPPVYHGNPVSDKGSLVFMDFGWDFLHMIRKAGFSSVKLRFYWSEVYGHLGAGQHYIHAVKG
jgi:SAM-dependent methyltransferase